MEQRLKGGLVEDLRYEDLGVAGLLLRVVDVGEVSDFVRRTLGPLLDPQTYGGDLLETLWQFLSADGNRHAAAQLLHGLRARGAAGAPGTWPAVTVGIPDITVEQRALSYCAEEAGLRRWARTRHASPNWSKGCGRLKLRRIREVLDERNQASVARTEGMPRAAPNT